MSVAVLAWAGWDYYVTYTQLLTGLIFFEPYQAWLVLAACFAGILLCWHLWGAPLGIFAFMT